MLDQYIGFEFKYIRTENLYINLINWNYNFVSNYCSAKTGPNGFMFGDNNIIHLAIIIALHFSLNYAPMIFLHSNILETRIPKIL